MITILSLYIYEFIGAGLFSLLFLIYAFMYRPLIDFKRLKDKGLLNGEEFWKSFGFNRDPPEKKINSLRILQTRFQ